MKTLISLFLLGGMLAFFPGCAGPDIKVAHWSSDKVLDYCLVTRDDAQDTTRIKSPEVAFGPDETETPDSYHYWLVAERKDGAGVNYFLLLYTERTSDQSWAFWQSITDGNGRVFPFNPVKSDIDNGVVEELLSAPLPRDYLETLKSGGLRWRLKGQQAEKSLTISPALVTGFLEKCDEVFARQPPPAQ